MQNMAKVGASGGRFAVGSVSSRGIFWIVIVVWAAATLYVARIWHFDFRLALLVILVVVAIGAVVTRRREPNADGRRSRTFLLVGLIFIAGAACGVFNYIEEGRHWHDLLVIPLPLVVGLYLIRRSLKSRATRDSLEKTSH
jgi:uncharacterized membrane protein YoaK (UPF0700 family)